SEGAIARPFCSRRPCRASPRRARARAGRLPCGAPRARHRHCAGSGFRYDFVAESSMRAVPSALLASLLLAPAALGHGGVWRPAGGDPTSPGGAGAPTTPGRGRGAATPGGGRSTTPDLDRWEAWWYFQREAYLPRHTVARHERAITSGAGSLVGHTVAESPPDSPLLPEDARALVLPVLLGALKDGNSEVVD